MGGAERNLLLSVLNHLPCGGSSSVSCSTPRSHLSISVAFNYKWLYIDGWSWSFQSNNLVTGNEESSQQGQETDKNNHRNDNRCNRISHGTGDAFNKKGNGGSNENRCTSKGVCDDVLERDG